MRYVLTCDCGSVDFDYDNVDFTCKECGHIYHEDLAGHHLLSED